MTTKFELTKKIETREYCATIVLTDDHYTLTMLDNNICFHRETRMIEALAETMQALFDADYRL